ncbi:peptide-binding protein [candidate division CSSED10-310 bacterium]|uniref:Peptide-binding protein n=1 Tax=candidate division CSSED10-310 bacterium TaxID=2855610 RepID=A0ABV6YXV4_UNCC1
MDKAYLRHFLTIILIVFAISCTQHKEETASSKKGKKLIEKPTIRDITINKKGKQEPLPKRSTPTDSLVYNLQAEPITLNPLLVTDLNSYLVTYLIFESLIDIDNQLHYVPRLASSWDISSDSKTITFHLKKDVTWHDGKKLTAQDVLFTFHKAIDDEVASFRFKGAFEEVEKVEAPNELTFRVHYKRPLASALQNWTSFGILPKHIYSKVNFTQSSLDVKPVGSGPYVFVEWKKGKYLKLTEHQQYWLGPPKIKNIIFRAIPSQNIALKSFIRGDLDGLEVTPSQWAKNTSSTQLKKICNMYKFPTLNFFVVAWNADGSNPYFSDRNMRRAMTLATDRQSIIQKLLFGLAESCTGPFSPQSWGYNHSIKPLPFDLEKAGKLLDDAGWKDTDQDGVRDHEGTPFRFSLNIPINNRQAEQVASMLQYNLEMIGILMNIVRLENASYIDHLMKKEFHACLMALALSVDPDNYQLLHSSQIKHGLNLTSYHNPEVDLLVERGRKTFDHKERIKIYHQVHQLVHEDQPYTFLFSRPQLYYFHKAIRNIKISPMPLYLFFPGILEWSIEHKQS